MPIMERDLRNSNFSLRFGSRVGFHEQMRSCHQVPIPHAVDCWKASLKNRDDSNDFTHIFYFYVFLLLFVAVEKHPSCGNFHHLHVVLFFLQLQTATAEVRGTKTHWRDQARKTCCLIWRGNAGSQWSMKFWRMMRSEIQRFTWKRIPQTIRWFHTFINPEQIWGQGVGMFTLPETKHSHGKSTIFWWYLPGKMGDVHGFSWAMLVWGEGIPW